MTLEELTPEAIALMKRLLHNPQPVEDTPTLQLLRADRIVMGVAKVHLTATGGRLLQQVALAEMR